MREAAAFIRSFPGTTTVYGMKGGPGATDFSYAVCPPTDPEVLEGDEWAQVEDAEIDEALDGGRHMETPQGLKVGQIRFGAAREEGRAPAHDGEYLKVYYRPGHDGYIVTHNAGIEWTDESDAEDRDGELDAEAQAIVAQDLGEAATGHIGAEEFGLMVSAGWVTPCEACDRTGDATVATVAVEVRCPECGETRMQHLCAECASATRRAPDEARWCEDCRRKAAMASRGD